MYYGRISDAELEAMRERNEKAIKQCITNMGQKLILHPVHKVFRHEN